MCLLAGQSFDWRNRVRRKKGAKSSEAGGARDGSPVPLTRDILHSSTDDVAIVGRPIHKEATLLISWSPNKFISPSPSPSTSRNCTDPEQNRIQLSSALLPLSESKKITPPSQDFGGFQCYLVGYIVGWIGSWRFCRFKNRGHLWFLFRGRLDGSVSCVRERVCTLIRVAHSNSEVAMMTMMMIALVPIMLGASWWCLGSDFQNLVLVPSMSCVARQEEVWVVHGRWEKMNYELSTCIVSPVAFCVGWIRNLQLSSYWNLKIAMTVMMTMIITLVPEVWTLIASFVTWG